MCRSFSTTRAGMVAVTTPGPSSGTCRPGPMICVGFATRSAWPSRSCSAVASVELSLSPTPGRSPAIRAILTNTTGGRSDHPASVEMFRRLGGDQAAAVAARDFAELTEQSAGEFNRVCHPLYSSKPGFVDESRQGLARSIHTTEVNLHYFRNEAPRFDAWSALAEVSCPVLIVAGGDGPHFPLSVLGGP